MRLVYQYPRLCLLAISAMVDGARPYNGSALEESMSFGELARMFTVEVEQRLCDSKWDVALKCPGGVRFLRSGLETREEASIAEIEGLFVACEMLETMCVLAAEGRVSLPDKGSPI